MINTLVIAGIGPGEYEQMTMQVIKALQEADIIVGYSVYIDIVRPYFSNKEYVATPMKKEEERCRIALEFANEGKKVVFICSGDAGIYGLAGLITCIAQKDFPNINIKVLAGITAASSGAALLGAPLIHDFAAISLSDSLTSWQTISLRLKYASLADFCIVLYNPSSHKRSSYLEKAVSILLDYLPNTRPCGIAENSGRQGENIYLCTLQELKSYKVSMFATIFIGNSNTKIINGKLITPRGYSFEREEAFI